MPRAQLGERAGLVACGVADDDVQPTEPAEDVGHQRGDLSAVGDVGGKRGGPLRRVPLQRLGQPVGTATGDRHRRPRVEEGASDRPADATAAPGDQYDGTGEVERRCSHGRIIPVFLLLT
jgi:hypothetical protein